MTGVLYLLLAIAGVFGFLFARSRLYVAGDPAATLENLTGNEGLARFGLGMELTIVLLQLLVALSFYLLFRRVSTFAAGALVGFAFLGAMCVLTAVMAYSQALDVALGSGGAPGGDRATSSVPTSGSPGRVRRPPSTVCSSGSRPSANCGWSGTC